MNIEAIHRLVTARRYQIKLHAIQHGLEEGFGESEIVGAILSGRIIEKYPERKRALICGEVMNWNGKNLHSEEDEKDNHETT